MGVTHMNSIPWFVFMSAYKCCFCSNQKYAEANTMLTPTENIISLELYKTD